MKINEKINSGTNRFLAVHLDKIRSKMCQGIPTRITSVRVCKRDYCIHGVSLLSFAADWHALRFSSVCFVCC